MSPLVRLPLLGTGFMRASPPHSRRSLGRLLGQLILIGIPCACASAAGRASRRSAGCSANLIVVSEEVSKVVAVRRDRPRLSDDSAIGQPPWLSRLP